MKYQMTVAEQKIVGLVATVSRSIHPNGRKNVYSTSKPWGRPGKGYRGKAEANRLRRRKDRENTLNSRSSKSVDLSLAFKAPGSMKWK